MVSLEQLREHETVRTAPVSVLVTVTSAPGSAPPLESRTTPEI